MVVDYKKILQMSVVGVSQRGISDVTSFSRNTVAAVLGAAKAQGVVYDDVAQMEPAAVRELLIPKPGRESGRTPPDWAEVHAEMVRPNVTLQLLWNEYAVRTRQAGLVPYSYTQFRAAHQDRIDDLLLADPTRQVAQPDRGESNGGSDHRPHHHKRSQDNPDPHRFPAQALQTHRLGCTRTGSHPLTGVAHHPQHTGSHKPRPLAQSPPDHWLTFSEVSTLMNPSSSNGWRRHQN